MNKIKLIHWGSTGLLSLLMLFSASMYLFQNPMVAESFTGLGYPTYLIYPLALLKVLGVIAVVSKKSPTLKEWAYAGFFFNIMLAVSAHIAAGDGEHGGALAGLVFLLASYATDRRLAQARLE